MDYDVVENYDDFKYLDDFLLKFFLKILSKPIGTEKALEIIKVIDALRHDSRSIYWKDGHRAPERQFVYDYILENFDFNFKLV